MFTNMKFIISGRGNDVQIAKDWISERGGTVLTGREHHLSRVHYLVALKGAGKKLVEAAVQRNIAVITLEELQQLCQGRGIRLLSVEDIRAARARESEEVVDDESSDESVTISPTLSPKKLSQFRHGLDPSTFNKHCSSAFATTRQDSDFHHLNQRGNLSAHAAGTVVTQGPIVDSPSSKQGLAHRRLHLRQDKAQPQQDQQRGHPQTQTQTLQPTKSKPIPKIILDDSSDDILLLGGGALSGAVQTGKGMVHQSPPPATIFSGHNAMRSPLKRGGPISSNSFGTTIRSQSDSPNSRMFPRPGGHHPQASFREERAARTTTPRQRLVTFLSPPEHTDPVQGFGNTANTSRLALSARDPRPTPFPSTTATSTMNRPQLSSDEVGTKLQQPSHNSQRGSVFGQPLQSNTLQPPGAKDLNVSRSAPPVADTKTPAPRRPTVSPLPSKRVQNLNPPAKPHHSPQPRNPTQLHTQTSVPAPTPRQSPRRSISPSTQGLANGFQSKKQPGAGDSLDADEEAFLRQVRDSPFTKQVDTDSALNIYRQIVDRAAPVRFDDIAGLADCKEDLRLQVILPQIRPHLFQSKLRTPATGFLLFGPPGTGKTMLAKAIANACSMTFFNISASAITSKWVGDSEKMIRTLFAVAKALAPSIIFFDEIDSMLQSRGSATETEGSRRLKTEFLTQTDGAGNDDSKSRVLILGATNRPFDLDDAVLRRLSTRIFVPMPDFDARMWLLQNLLSGESSFTEEEWLELAHRTEGYSGSDIENVCKQMARYPIAELGEAAFLPPDSSLNDDTPIRKINIWDARRALERIGPSTAPETIQRLREWDRLHGTHRLIKQNILDHSLHQR